MAAPESDELEERLAAGDFSSWLGEMQGALRGENESDVPCAGCTACCTSSQFVHIGPDETDTLAHIPAELVFPAPLMPAGHVLLGYDERGHCPMLGDDGCSIYDHRPRTCRTYDCRVFPAAGIEADADGDDDKALIARRARRWEFSVATPDDRTRLAAVRAAAAFLERHRAALPDRMVPASPTPLAVLAVEVHEAFLPADRETEREPTVAEIENRIEGLRRTDR
jgi:Fe-S-cluster containining protein